MTRLGSTLSPPPSFEVLVVNVALYSFLAVFAASVSSRKDLQRLSSVPRFIVVTAILRIVWFGSEYAGWGDTAGCQDPKAIVSFFGRLAAVSLFAAFSSVIFFWWDVLRSDPNALTTQIGGPPSTSPPAATSTSATAQRISDHTINEDILLQKTGWRLFCQPKTVDILIKFWVFVVLGGLFLYKMFNCDDRGRETVANAEIVTIAFFMGLLAVGYFFVGLQLRSQLSLRESVSSTQLQFRITMISVCCVVLFSVRCILFLLYPVFGVRLRGWSRSVLYPWMFYTIPEIVPSFVMLLFLVKRRRFKVALEDALLVAPTEHQIAAENSLRIFRI